MFGKYFQKVKIFAYNFLNQKEKKTYPTTVRENLDELSHNTDDKQLKINTLLYIKQLKNTYYKYTDKTKFNKELYDNFVKEDNFDGGETAFDDDDNVRIFDKYILEYIKNRNDIITYIQCKNKDIIIKTKMEDLKDIRSSEEKMDLLFVIDMSDKEIFKYCYELVKNQSNITTKAIALSMVYKFNNEYVRIKINSKSGTYHPYIILENSLQQN